MVSNCSPRIQILMAVYNGSQFLADQMDSLLNQTYPNIEILVSDDCSTDNSLSILEGYALRDSRVKLVLQNQRYGSAKEHFMALFQLADAPYVMTSDQDDVWDSTKVEKTLETMLANEVAPAFPVLVCTDLRVVDQNLTPIAPSFLRYSGMDASKLDFGYFLASCLVTGCTMMINAPLLELMKAPVDSKKIVMHDWWASLVAAAFGRVVYSNQQTISYRQHQNNSVGAERFSISGAIASLGEKKATELSTFPQVEEFVRLFGKKCPSEYYSQAKSYMKIRDCLNPISKLRLAGRADVWRHGILRNLATALTLLSIR